MINEPKLFAAVSTSKNCRVWQTTPAQECGKNAFDKRHYFTSTSASNTKKKHTCQLTESADAITGAHGYDGTSTEGATKRSWPLRWQRVSRPTLRWFTSRSLGDLGEPTDTKKHWTGKCVQSIRERKTTMVHILFWERTSGQLCHCCDQYTVFKRLRDRLFDFCL